MTAARQNHPSRYRVPENWSFPDLTEVLRAGIVEVAPVVEASVSEYLDTAEKDLQRFGASLVRRSGASDEGWELSLPDGIDGGPHRVPLGADTAVPDGLATLVSGLARGRVLDRHATVRCERIRRGWTQGGTLVVEISDESLYATVTTPGAAPLDSRRELAVDPGPAARPKVLRRLAKSLIAHGAIPVLAGNGLSGVLDRTPDVGRRKPRASRKFDGAAVDAITFLAAQDAAMISQDVRLRTGQQDVHEVRVATRRARSTLKIFADQFDPAAVSRLNGELAWYAALLGEVRDRQVQRERFASTLAKLPDELVLGPVAATIEHQLLGEQLRAGTTLRDAMAGARYHELLRTFSEFVRHPPLAPQSRSRTDTNATSAAARRAGRTARRRLDLALATGNDEQLHAARKAAKRARYAAELGNGRGDGQRTAVKTFKELQDILGEFQDSAVAAELLRRLGAVTHADPAQNGFTFGLLYEQEARRAVHARRAAARWRRHH